MWSKKNKHLNVSGSIMVSFGSAAPPLPLKGVLVDVYQVLFDSEGNSQIERLNEHAARTTITGDFSFNDIPVSVEIQMVIPGSPPYTPEEIVNLYSLPNLIFRVTTEAEVLTTGTSEGLQIIDIYDEREEINQEWWLVHTERKQVPLSGSPPISVLIPEGNEQATLMAGMAQPPVTIPGKEFHFLRVGRIVRQEIGELGDIRPQYSGKPGYVTSSIASFFPHNIDAPFGGNLQFGGHFGLDFLTSPLSDNLYYTISFWEYSGVLTNTFDRSHLTNEKKFLGPLFNKRYILPTLALPNGKWENLNLGPFDADITAVEPPHDPTLVGTSIRVYKRPGLPNLATEYWPFWDLIARWNSREASNELILLTIEVYEKTGGTDNNPELTKLAMTTSINDHMPLLIDNHRAKPRLFDWRTGFAMFSPESVSSPAVFDPCSQMPVTAGHVNSNECILTKYSVEDEDGNPHKHLKRYGLSVEFTPRQVTGAPSTANILLKDQFSGYKDIHGQYTTTMASSPEYIIQNFESVIVPKNDDAWPPEPMGDLPSPCQQYAAEVKLGCSVRTINGWGKLFGSRHISRHIIIKR